MNVLATPAPESARALSSGSFESEQRHSCEAALLDLGVNEILFAYQIYNVLKLPSDLSNREVSSNISLQYTYYNQILAGLGRGRQVVLAMAISINPKNSVPHKDIRPTPVFGVRDRFCGVKGRKPLRLTFFHLRGLESCGNFFLV
jgi:hypothetical protein